MGMIIDGKAVAARLRQEVAGGVRALGVAPGLAAVRVGEDPASATYVRSKIKASGEVGIRSLEHHFPESVSEKELLAWTEELNRDRTVHAILVQLPLPRHIDTQRILAAVRPEKDVDGFHPLNLGALVAGRPGPRPCTPAGVLRLLDAYQVPISGARAVVVGRSLIVGKPAALLLLERNATVTLCHSRTRELAEHVAQADIVVAAVGRPALIKGAWIKPGAAVIDVGINRVNGKLVGDVEFGAARERAGAITPVPGGVGPMTVAMLLHNTLELARRALA